MTYKESFVNKSSYNLFLERNRIMISSVGFVSSFYSSFEYAWVFILLFLMPFFQFYFSNLRLKKALFWPLFVFIILQLFCYYFSFFREFYFISIIIWIYLILQKKEKLVKSRLWLSRLYTTISSFLFLISTVGILCYKERFIIRSAMKPTDHYVFYRIASPVGLPGSGGDWDGLISKYEGVILKERFVSLNCGQFVTLEKNNENGGIPYIEDVIAKEGKCPFYH